VDAISGESVVTWDPWNSGLGLKWSSDGRQLLTGSEMGVQLYDMASARSTKQAYLLFEYDTKHYTTSLSFFDGHRYILTDHGLVGIPPQHRPPCATDARVLHCSETVLRLRDDGWIWLVGGEKGEQRVCWLPPTYRCAEPRFNRNIAISRSKVMLVTDSGHFVSIDLKRWLENMDTGS